MTDSENLVPELCAPVDPITPVTPRRIPWFAAWLVAPLIWIVPTRIGPHLAASSLRAALSAAVGGVLLFLGWVYGAVNQSHSYTLVGQLSWIDELRRPIAGAAAMFYDIANSTMEIAMIALVAAAMFAIALLSPLLIGPLIALGETRRALYSRALKLFLWSLLALWPLSWLLPAIAMKTQFGGNTELPLLAAVLLFGVWWLTILLRLAARFSGTPTGPRWDSFAMLCEGCGYHLANLPRSGNCPECNREIHNSMPERRVAPAFARASGLGASCAAFWTTLRAVLFRRDFWATLSVWREPIAARQFAFGVALLVGICVVLSAGIRKASNFSQPTFWPNLPLSMQELVVVFPRWLNLSLIILNSFLAGVLGGWMAILACALIVGRFGFGHCGRKSIAFGYATAFLLYPAVFIVLGTWAHRVGERIGWPRGSIRVAPDTYIDLASTVELSLFLPAAVAVLFAVNKIRLALLATRFANG